MPWQIFRPRRRSRSSLRYELSSTCPRLMCTHSTGPSKSAIQRYHIVRALGLATALKCCSNFMNALAIRRAALRITAKVILIRRAGINQSPCIILLRMCRIQFKHRGISCTLGYSHIIYAMWYSHIIYAIIYIFQQWSLFSFAKRRFL